MTIVKTKKRPLSPHLTIYKPQITSVFSILHRITGVVFFIGLITVMWTFILQMTGCDCLMNSMKNLCQTIFGKIIFFSLIYSMMFHTCGGVRYLFWSCHKGFNLKNVEASAYFIIFSALALTIILIFIAKT